MLGRKILYPFWNLLFNISLVGLHKGGGYSIEISGERKLLKYLKRKFQSGSVIVFDIGAHYGEYTLEIMKYLSDSYIHCFEPASKSFIILTRNLSEFKNVKINKLAVSDKSEVRILWGPANDSVLCSLYKIDHHPNSKSKDDYSEVEHVRTITLDEYCADNEINRIDFLKIDVEGNELKVLEGARTLLKERRIQNIQFEFGIGNIESGNHFKNFYNLLAEDYKIYQLVVDGMIEIKKYKTEMEIYKLTNFFAELN